MAKNYYEILEVSQDASQDEIKKSYHRLVMKYHPDKNPGDKSAEEKIKEINNAFDVLKNPVTRREYDNSLAVEDDDFDDYYDTYSTAQSAYDDDYDDDEEDDDYDDYDDGEDDYMEQASYKSTARKTNTNTNTAKNKTDGKSKGKDTNPLMNDSWGSDLGGTIYELVHQPWYSLFGMAVLYSAVIMGLGIKFIDRLVRFIFSKPFPKQTDAPKNFVMSYVQNNKFFTSVFRATVLVGFAGIKLVLLGIRFVYMMIAGLLKAIADS